MALCCLAVALAAATGSWVAAAEPVAIEHDALEPRVAFAVRELRAALQLHGHHRDDAATTGVREPVDEGGGGWRVRLVLRQRDRDRNHPESYSIRAAPSARRVTVTGGGTVGLMYGGLRLSEMLRHDAAVDAGAPSRSGSPLARVANASVAAPLLTQRGLKINFPLDARTPSYGDAGDSAQHNIATMWNLTFWCGKRLFCAICIPEMIILPRQARDKYRTSTRKRSVLCREAHFDHMARHQYNLLSLWSLTPFASMLDYSGGPYEGLSLDDVYSADIDWCGGTHKNACFDLYTRHRVICQDRLGTNKRHVRKQARGVVCVCGRRVAKNRESMSCNDLVTPHVLQNLKLVKKISISEKIAFWRQVMSLADQRGVDKTDQPLASLSFLGPFWAVRALVPSLAW